MLMKRFHQNWQYESPTALMTCSTLKCGDKSYIVFGGHDKKLYLMDNDLTIIDDIEFDGWVRCSHSADIDKDNRDEILVGAGDGSFLVLNVNQETNKLMGIMHYKSNGKVNCCIAGDLFRDGNLEFIFGGEDKTLKIFKNIQSKQPDITLYYDSWVMACTIGFLKLPKYTTPIMGLFIGTKNGLLQCMQIKDNEIDILWQRNMYAQINDIKIGDVTNDGYNEIVIGTEEGYIKILDGEGKRVKYIYVEDSRPISLLIDDIDGDKANEIVAGCANGSLRIYHNIEMNSKEFNLKWKTKGKTSIKHVSIMKDEEKGLKNMVYGGYDRIIRSIYDFEWGQKPILEIPTRFKKPEIPIIESDTKPEAVPTNLREFITKIFNENKVFVNINLITQELINFGYTQEQIDEELEAMKSEKIISCDNINIPAWFLAGDETIEKIKVEEGILVEKIPAIPTPSTEIIEKEPVSKVLEAKIRSEESLKEVILNFLKEKKLISTKGNFINGIVEKGHTKLKVEKEITLLKDQGIIQYSRSAPRGWSLSSEAPVKEPIKAAEVSIEAVDSSKLEESIINFLKEKKIVSTKAEFVKGIVSLGFNQKNVEKQIEILKNSNKIKYSRSAPRGWSLS